jgi:anti-anti-sigma factor
MASVCCNGGVEVRTEDGCFTVRVCCNGDERTVHAVGQLDISSRELMAQTCLDGVHRTVIVDLTELTFMDCGGYRAIVEARTGLEHRGGSLTLTHPTGEPARLLTLIDELLAVG